MSLALFAFAACSDDDNTPDEKTLKVVYTPQDVLVGGATVSFNIESNTDWTISVPQDGTWAVPSVTKGSGDKKVDVVVAENKGDNKREVTLTVTAGTLTQKVRIVQLGLKPEATLSVEYTPVDIAASGGTATFDIKSNTDWTIEVPQDKPWATPSAASGNGNKTIDVQIDANDGAARDVTLKVKAGTLSKDVKIVQLGTGEVTLTIEYTPVDIAAAGGTATFDIKSNADWTIEVQQGKTWATPSATSGNGDKKIDVQIGANDGAARDVTLTVKAGTLEKPVKINQLGETGPNGILYSFNIDEMADFEELTTVFATFTNLDKDNDGYPWQAAQVVDGEGQPTGDISVTSASWVSTGALTPENYLVMPPQALATDGKINFTVKAQDPDYPADKFKIIISDSEITLANCRDAEALHTHTLADGNQYSKEIDIPASYNGKTIYVGICHFDCTDAFRINLEKIEISHAGTRGVAAVPVVPVSQRTKGVYVPVSRK